MKAKNKKDGTELIDYEKKKCLVCGVVHVTSLLLSMHHAEIILCLYCSRKLKDSLVEVTYER